MAGGKQREVERERSVQGSAWDGVHLGYFSDPAIAASLVEIVLDKAAECRPAAVVDIGGGTGFILSELDRRGLDPSVALVDVDVSHTQIGAIRHSRIRGVPGSVDGFRRERLLPEGGRMLFIMRSVLHYLGPEGLGQALRHVRSQMERGEYFVHQTACFDTPRMAECMNALYAGLGTGKRYPALPDLTAALEAAGFAVCSHRRCPALTLTSEELESRYGVAPATLASIRRELGARFADVPEVFEAGPDRFVACLYYRVFVTRSA